jgi:hypothetical protein
MVNNPTKNRVVLAIIAFCFASSQLFYCISASAKTPSTICSDVKQKKILETNAKGWPLFMQNSRNTGLSLNKVTGKPAVKWKYTVDGWPSTPVVASDGTIYFCATIGNVMTEDIQYGGLFAISPNGKRKWLFKVKGGAGNTPSIGKDGTVYFSVNDEEKQKKSDAIYAVAPSGKLKWRCGLDSSVSSAAVIGNDGTIYFYTDEFTEGGALCAIGATGKMKWAYKINCPDMYDMTPAIGTVSYTHLTLPTN